MSLRRFFQRNRKAEADRSSLENGRTSTYTSTTAPTHNFPGRDSVRLPETESTYTLEASQVETPIYIYYRIYDEDGAIPSKTSATPGDPFLGRIKAISVPPPHTVKAVKYSIAKVENITNRTDTSLFLTLHAQSPMDDAEKVTILNRTGLGSTPLEPLALVAKMSDSERSPLESERRGELASAEETDTTPPETQYLYYLLYADDYEIPSKVAIDPEKPSLGRIRADSVAPPHSPASIKRCISRVERSPDIAHANLFADISCDTPLKEGHISFRTDSPGLSPNKPMAIVEVPINQISIVEVEIPSISDGRYIIKNRAANFFWVAGSRSIKMVNLWYAPNMLAEKHSGNTQCQWDITQDTNGNISMESVYSPSSWVGAEMSASTVPIPWRSIQADDKFYYLTTDMNHDSQNPRVPMVQPGSYSSGKKLEKVRNVPGGMATLTEGDHRQMWEFIRV